MQNELPPETQHLLAFLETAAKHIIEIPQADGSVLRVPETDYEKVFWEALNLNTNKAGLFTKRLKDFEGLAAQAKHHMTAGRAHVLMGAMLDEAMGFRYGVISKSSETVRDKHNNQANVIDKIKSHKEERKVTLQGEGRRGLAEMIMGKNKQDEAAQSA